MRCELLRSMLPWCVWQSVYTPAPCKSGRTDLGPVSGGAPGGLKEHYIRWDPDIPHGFVAAFEKLLWPLVIELSVDSTVSASTLLDTDILEKAHKTAFR